MSVPDRTAAAMADRWDYHYEQAERLLDEIASLQHDPTSVPLNRRWQLNLFATVAQAHATLANACANSSFNFEETKVVIDEHTIHDPRPHEFDGLARGQSREEPITQITDAPDAVGRDWAGNRHQYVRVDEETYEALLEIKRVRSMVQKRNVSFDEAIRTLLRFS